MVWNAGLATMDDGAIAKLLEKAREAVDYHRLGYADSDGDFDADTMVHIMDEFGKMLDDYEASVP